MHIRRFLLLNMLAAALLLTALPLPAHHSTAEYDMAALTSIKGTVTKFEWTNPHAYITIESKDEKGNVDVWMGELGSIGMLARVNWTRDTVKPGDQITMYGNRAKNGKTLMRLDKIVFASGQELSAQLR